MWRCKIPWRAITGSFASSLAAARKNHHDIAVGNIIGSNLFNTLVVVGIAGMIRPMAVEPIIISRDIMVMLFVTMMLYAVCRPRGGQAPIITRLEGLTLFVIYVFFIVWIASSSLSQPPPFA